MTDYDVVFRHGTVVDGTGAEPTIADVAVKGDTIVAVGTVTGRGAHEIDATGGLVAPGFVDVHTHYDGQATWESDLTPSSWHGVTTAVMGNCGVGFAPVRERDRDALIELMEGVEDIPGTALHEGLSWEWESFPEYLDALEKLPHDIDFGAQVPHGPLRLYVMGPRAMDLEPATAEESAEMGRLVGQALAAGALGFTTSRTLNHRSSTGGHAPTIKAEAAELFAIADAVRAAGAGVLQVVSDFFDLDGEFEMLRETARRSGRPMTMSVTETNREPDMWKSLLDRCAEATAAGIPMRGQVGVRPVGLLLSFDSSLNPFMHSPAFREIDDLPHAEKLALLRDPAVRREIIDRTVVDRSGGISGGKSVGDFTRMYALGAVPNYEPDPSNSVTAIAGRTGREPAEVAYDLMLDDDGRAFLYQPILNYARGNLDAVRAQLAHPASIPGLSDGGAHVGMICDSSFPSTLLQWWCRDRPDGRMRIQDAVAMQCRWTAEAVGLYDRGVLAPGYLADINVIDFDDLALAIPEVLRDLPAGGRRIVQRAHGYRHTFKSGVEIMRDGVRTTATPGKLLRGARPAPA